MSAKKFALMCKAYHIDLVAAGVTAEQCVNAYRKTYAKIPLVWRACDKAMKSAMANPGKQFRAAKSVFINHGSTLMITLPSGRTIYYRGARMERRVPRFLLIQGKTGLADCVDYVHPHGMRREIYGGLITENIVQGIARDILSHALVNLERAGIPVVAHVHDEAICEFEWVRERSALATQCEIMSEVPDWAKGFPIKVEGFVGQKYSKGSFDGAFTVEAVNGKILRTKN